MNIIEKYKLKKVQKLPGTNIVDNYETYPYYIKTDDEIIKKMIKIGWFYKVNVKVLREFFRKYPDYINEIITQKEEPLLYLLIENPELIKYVTQENRFSLIEVLDKVDLLLTKEQFQWLNNEEKVKQINRNKQHFYYGDNKEILKDVNGEIQLQLYEENNDLFDYLSFECKIKLIKENKSLISKLSNEEKIKLLEIDETLIDFCLDAPVVTKYLEKTSNEESELTYEKRENKKRIFNVLYNKGYINKMDKYSNLFQFGITGRLAKYPKLLQIINKIHDEREYFIHRNDNGILRKKTVGFEQIIEFLNDEVLENNSEEDLINYFNNPTAEAFRKIIRNAYGESAAKIFKNRPNVNLDMIEEPKIFDKRIVEALGENFVQQLMNYKVQNISYFIHTILDDSFMMQNFVNLYYYILVIMGEGIESINLAIQKFINLNQVLRNYKIMTLMLDKPGFAEFIILNEEEDNYFDNIEEIDNYLANINTHEKNIKYIGYKYIGLKNDELKAMLSILDGNIDVYDILTDEDLEILQVLKILNNSDDDEKIAILDIMNEHVDKFNPKRIHQIQRKVKNIYTRDLNQTIREKNSSIETQCERSYIDGIEIVDFKGEDFCFLASGVSGHTMSKCFEGSQKRPDPDKVVENWLYLDNGTATISASLLSETTIISEGSGRGCVSGGYTDFFGFENFNDNQILSIKSCDVGASHSPRSIEQLDDINLDTTARRVMYRLYDKNKSENYLKAKSNETVIKRYDDKGIKILPDFILVYDNNPAQLERAIIMAKEFAKHGHQIKIYRINREYYQDKSCGDDPRYSTPARTVSTELLDEVYRVIKGEGRDAR